MRLAQLLFKDVHYLIPKVFGRSVNGGDCKDSFGIDFPSLEPIDGTAILGAANVDKGVLA